MSQSKQFKKVKLYRALKVVFYFLGLPLFLFAVFCTAIKFIGQDPFVGTASSTLDMGFFVGYERFITSPALFGIWCAFGVWAFISIIHLILAKTVKSRRVRMFAVLAVVLIVMLGGTFVMDSVFESKIDALIEEAPAGVNIQDYKSQLSYYSHVSYFRKKNGLAKTLKEQVQLLEKVYNVEWQGVDKSGNAGNIANKPVTYADVISDPDAEGKVQIGVDLNGDGKVTADYEGRQLVRVAPNGNGELVLDGKVYSHYFCVNRTAMNGEVVNTWYAKDLQPIATEYGKKVMHRTTDGIYGEGLYNPNGMLSDGWIFSFDNVLNILEDYYEAQAELDAISKAAGDQYAGQLAALKEAAKTARDDYYTGKSEEHVDAWTSALYSQENTFTENFSLTSGELEYLISQVALLLGDNNLFDYAFANVGDLIGVIGGMLGDLKPIVESIFKGGELNLSTLIANQDTLNTVIDIIKQSFKPGEADYQIEELYLVISYKEDKDHLYVALCRGSNGKADRTEEGTLFDIDFTDEVLDSANGEYAFDLDSLSTALNNVLTAACGKIDILNTVLGLVLSDVTFNGETYKGLVVSGITIPIINAKGEFALDVKGILAGLLQNWYSYQSPVIKPVWEFYETAAKADDEAQVALAKALAKYERAVYEATTYGSMMGSTLVGDNLGSGAYPASLGLTDLASVRQLKSDLSYMRTYFPLYSFRDMMLTFSGIVMLFYFLSFIAAEKEEYYEKGLLSAGPADKNKTGEVK